MVTFNVNQDDYKIISSLGQSFEGRAAVYLAQHIPSGSMVAIKKFNMDKIGEDNYLLVELEIKKTKELRHKYVLPYYATFVHGPEVCVVSPLMGYGSCKDLLNQHFNDGLPEQAIVIILRDLLDALIYIHKKGYIHRAIKASHILISTTGKICVTGFRHTCYMVRRGRWQEKVHFFSASERVNLNWLSPEVLEQNMKGYNSKADMYSVGMLLCELGNGVEPFAGMAPTLMLCEKLRGCTPHLLDCTTVSLDENGDGSSGDCDINPKLLERRFSGDLHEIVNVCLSHDPQLRPSAEKLMTHRIFKTIKKSPPLTDLLKPAMPLSDRVAFNLDDIETMDVMNKLSNLDVNSCEWDF
ncbi:STE20-related kinase adapter protein alpha [Anthonomus grandis grandis]|uniref:STE20-related kinase adapter protein alpha n=1 Tax=Anthonomus grandis grandis TaxID=2921223 RepID=UPI0021662065|nr:STE20-related kinase adapter protein alpha [Anthonomus grandis grandis]